MSFQKYLEELVDSGRPLSISKLVNLSGMGADDLQDFRAAWARMETGRRRQLLAELVDLAEDTAELNFDAVFLGGVADPDDGVRLQAVRGLWEYEGREFIRPLLDMLRRDPSPAVRTEAALALGRYALRAEFQYLRRSDAALIDEALRDAVEDEAEEPEVRGRALESIAVRSHDWVPPLIREAYESTERTLRRSAVHAMGRTCEPEWLPEVTAELSSADPAMRFEAALAAGSIGDGSVLPRLLELLDDEDGEVQEAAIDALGQIGGPRAKRALQGLLNSGEERLREAAEEALAELEFSEDPLGFKISDGA